jgi:hypothetical protein
MNGHPAAAQHLAELDERFESHLASLRERAAAARDAVQNRVASLDAAMGPRGGPELSPGSAPWNSDMTIEEPPPYVAPAPHQYAENALIPDAPLISKEDPLSKLDVDDDGIPLWQD